MSPFARKELEAYRVRAGCVSHTSKQYLPHTASGRNPVTSVTWIFFPTSYCESFRHMVKLDEFCSEFPKLQPRSCPWHFTLLASYGIPQCDQNLKFCFSALYHTAILFPKCSNSLFFYTKFFFFFLKSTFIVFLEKHWGFVKYLKQHVFCIVSVCVSR